MNSVPAAWSAQGHRGPHRGGEQLGGQHPRSGSEGGARRDTKHVADDEPQADQETDYVRHVVFDDNDGFMTFLAFFKHTLRKLEERSFAPAPPRSPHRA